MILYLSNAIDTEAHSMVHFRKWKWMAKSLLQSKLGCSRCLKRMFCSLITPIYHTTQSSPLQPKHENKQSGQCTAFSCHNFLYINTDIEDIRLQQKSPEENRIPPLLWGNSLWITPGPVPGPVFVLWLHTDMHDFHVIHDAWKAGILKLWTFHDWIFFSSVAFAKM